MKSNKILVSLVAAFTLLIVMASGVNAFAQISSIEVNNAEAVVFGQINVAATAGESLPVRVLFVARQNASDVRIKAELSSRGKDYSTETERFDVIAGGIYSKTLKVQMPLNLNPSEKLHLNVEIKNSAFGTADQKTIPINAQRESYQLEILDAEMDTKVNAGAVLPITVVIKNRGSHFAEDTFVTVRIPALGIQERAYFGDLSARDQAEPDKEDAVERMLSVRIPDNAKAGIYAVEIEATNDDSTVALSKRVAISDNGGESMVVTSSNSKTFAVGEESTYRMTILNSGNKARVYTLAVETLSENLNVELADSVVVIPAGSSRALDIDVTASKEGAYAFAISVISDGNLVKKETFAAKVEGKEAFEGNATVVLTVILAIVFIVLLIVLIVLLTRKPEKTKEFGESYY
ncbi:hypothetical protein FJZ18_00960 [Candidatus Pacearchaeota archaeon]|nr:hypothetical protein [Candidatus Pacearchaeota archaeon]